MRLFKKIPNLFLITVLMLQFPALLCSCSHMNPISGEPSPEPSQIASTPQTTNITYAFPDLPVPIELEKVKSKTMVIKTTDFQGGILVLKGRVTMNSLIDFFTKTLPMHGWELVGRVNAEQSFLAFSKENNSYCLIQIHEPIAFKTRVHIWISEPIVH
ncbi:MAG: hypothetical protein GWP10_04640 [Nitrospiraceae bacterium]|nr:hypothetical protein [Nitrospiraceae bacterium]